MKTRPVGEGGPKEGDQKSEGKNKNEKDEKKLHPYAPKNKLRTEGVRELKYDRYSATSFANFEKDLRLVAGQEFGDLFGYVIEGTMPPENLPEPTSVESIHEDELDTINTVIKSYEDMGTNTTERDQRSLERSRERKERMIQEFGSISDAKRQLMNIALQEKYKAEVKEVISKKKKHETDSPKLYWLIRRNMSEESTDKVKEHLAEEWDESEKLQDPVELWKAIKLTHTAYSTRNPFQDKQQLRQAYADMKMHSGETLLNMKVRFTTAIRAIESVGITVHSEEDQAADFIAKLDTRWASLKTQLANDYLRNVSSQPKTLMDAYLVAAAWKVVLTTSTGQTSTVFATTLKTRVEKKKNHGETGNKSNQDHDTVVARAPKGGCHLCGGPHYLKECPQKEELKNYRLALNSQVPGLSRQEQRLQAQRRGLT